MPVKLVINNWPDKLPNIQKATVTAIIIRTKQDETPDIQKFVRCYKWELPTVEVLSIET
ncbi:MAG: hypothetical protein HOD92_13830 [Deltaproteobacteria bacterium]|jgi:hypothetical protein|nr:hypothetical protein [Deltaproteobacteria bacterium]MBT4525992.1 hypothetical protein [Deltaproteobacteria bacterium]